MKPILFNTEMVRAILDGRKSVTRRVIKPQPPENFDYMVYSRTSHKYLRFGFKNSGALWKRKLPYCPGDILYVRETWAHPSQHEIERGVYKNMYLYKADYPFQPFAWDRWRPSIHMPKEAARLFLRVTGVRVERLWDITEEQAEKEGFFRGWSLTEHSSIATSARQAFM